MAFAAAIYQFTLEGLAPLMLMKMRGESFSSYGFTRRNVCRSLMFGISLAFFYDLIVSWHARVLLWIPLYRQPAVRMSIAAGFPAGLSGLIITVLTWGFLEGFFGIYLARKVNMIVHHDGHGWLAPGVLAFALFNGGIHLIVGQGFEGFLTSFASGYAITVVPAITRNAWGGTLVQTLTDAVGGI